jgi:hypothetical protein
MSVTQLVLPLHDATIEPLHVSIEPLHAAAEAVADPAATESAAKPLNIATDPAAAGVALIETSCLCVRV